VRASTQWLRELVGVDFTPAQMAERLTAGGVEVEALHPFGEELAEVVVAEVRAKAAHPRRDKLTVVDVFDGASVHTVVCGAPNVPAVGGRVLLARVGAVLPGGLAIAERELAGVVSRGMLCSESELGIGAEGDGIVVLGPADDAPLGTRADEAFGLRDVALEISLTPNRPDCLGHIGLARELAALCGVPFALPATGESFALRALHAAHGTIAADGGDVTVTIASPERCPRYAATLVRGVQVGASPLRVRARLHTLGVRAISNVVDATNLALFEWGHPTHAFDLARVAGRHITVRLAVDGETMRTLDGVERTLTRDDLLICDGNGPVAIAGVMGGADTEIRAETRDVLLECAWFEPRGVRRTARRLGLHTDASHRFERGVDPDAVDAVARRVSALVRGLGGGDIGREGVDVHPLPRAEVRLQLRGDRLRAMLGDPEATLDAAALILGRLGCAVSTTPAPVPPGTVLDVVAPGWRPDLTREIDLIEEVARVRGYDRIPTIVPNVRPSVTGTPPRVRFGRRLREHAAAAGLYEAINFAFLAPADLAACAVSRAAVPLANPLSEERSVLRTSLVPGLLGDVRRAQRHQGERVALFELARVFAPQTDGPLPIERRELGVVLSGPRARWLGDVEALDFFDLKGVVASLVSSACGLAIDTVVDARLDASVEDGGAPFLHPRRRARVRVGERDAGVLGEVHPDVIDAVGLVGRPLVAVLDVEALYDATVAAGLPRARPLPRFPHVTRDLALVVAESVVSADVAAALREAGQGLAEDVQVFDVYRGAGVPEGHKSLAFRVVYRDPSATLTDERVDRAHEQVSRVAREHFGGVLRA
jgi:phenylalanyl-tRNA synthetase beta chain